MPDRHASSRPSFAGTGFSEGDFSPKLEEGGEPYVASPNRRWQILLPLPLAGAYDYVAPMGLDVAPGDFVMVPLGRRLVPGVVWAAGREDGIAAGRLKPIDSVLDAPRMAAPLRRFVDWVAAYTLTPQGAVLRMTMSVSEALLPARPLVAGARRCPVGQGADLGAPPRPARARRRSAAPDWRSRARGGMRNRRGARPAR
jgi:primosomal protein N' (replication factor Y) (superfamily II helicase)